ncbi:toll/interleukin-1 receptor domain-containing protein [Brachybacterium sp. J153]|uniref:toll/interleukin-1 receptor domain-containing protein n=1 Tax=Brachybacterium sp. J153 TaxID=3116488 RepID=UPI002E75BC77|nr:toll/interleukin-1 receptor domain-containing protein [Brachybacterium sp. J153]MEE1618133.1 toll/interleukin-1 receptor domain-containing protein [Brachybacterium sp. J153]
MALDRQPAELTSCNQSRPIGRSTSNYRHIAQAIIAVVTQGGTLMSDIVDKPGKASNDDNDSQHLTTTSSDMPANGAAVKVFLSYARVDDEHLEFIEDFSKQLKYLVNSSTDDFHLDIFLDVHNLNWGDNWPRKIEEGLQAASIFMPFLSANYLRRPNCRKEFTQFYQGAKSLGVTELIMPVMLFGGQGFFSTESTDSIAAICAGINHISIKDGLRAGIGSREWRTAIWDTSEKFISAYQQAESQLAAQSQEVEIATPSTEEDDDDSEEPGLFDIQQSISSISIRMTAELSDMDPSIRKLGEVATNFTGNKPENPKQAQAWIVRAAEGFKGPSNRIGEIGTTVLELAREFDIEVRHLARIYANVPALASGGNDISDITDKLSGLETVKGQLNGLLDSFLIAESVSAAIRKALRPAREGLTKITDAITIMNTWKDLK